MKRGFGLIELMIVVAIVGIVSAIAIPSLIMVFNKKKCVEWYADNRYLVCREGSDGKEVCVRPRGACRVYEDKP